MLQKHAQFVFLLILLYSQCASAILVSRNVRTGGSCPPDILFRISRLVVKNKIKWSPAKYDLAYAEIENIISEKDADAQQLQRNILSFVHSNHYPETYGALFDALSGDFKPFTNSQNILSKQGVVLRSVIPSLFSNSKLKGETKWGRRMGEGWQAFFKSKPKYLDLIWPTSPPVTTDEIASTLLKLSQHLGEAEGAHARYSVPWKSHPFGNGDYSYPKQINEIVNRIEKRTYQVINGIQLHLGKDVTKELVKKETKPMGTVRLGLGYVWQSAFPFYDPLGKFQPSREAYQRGKVTEFVSVNYADRARLKYYSNWVNTLYRGLALTGGVSAGNAVYNFFVNSPIQSLVATGTEIQAMSRDPKKVEEANRNYENEPVGNPLVLEHYNQQIKILKEKIENEGDPDSKIANEIKVLEQQRDYYKK